MAKPTGAICNLDCEYCLFLSKEVLYLGSRFRMVEELQESYICQLLEGHECASEVVVACYKSFFHHVDRPMSTMAALLAAGRAPAELMETYATEDARRGRDAPCSCGSGRKWKHCHGGVRTG